MKVVFRTDASIHMGIGHLMRCLTLAEALQARGAQILFVCREHEGNLIAELQKKLVPVAVLPAPNKPGRFSRSEDYAVWLGVSQAMDAEQTIQALKGSKADWMIVDHYGLDFNWEIRLRPHVGKLLVIDDLANRHHNCDALLDQNILPEIDGGYAGLVPNHCRLLLGPRYAMLRPEFARERARLKQRDGELRRILVFLGGSDPTNETTKALNGIFQLDRPDLIIDVVVGSSNPNKEQVRRLSDASPNTIYHCQVDNMAELMSKADVSIGAGGSASWERCCLGLPAIVAVLADNQANIAVELAHAGALRNLGASVRLNPSDYSAAVRSLTQSDLRQMSRIASTLVDGQGAQRLAVELTGYH